MKNFSILFSLMGALPLLFMGCARNISPNTYHSASVGEAAFSYQGVIISIRNVEVKEAERLQDNYTGATLGALGGGLLAGSTIGKGYGSVAAAGVGAIAGGVGGAYLQDYLGTQGGIEYTIRLTNGQVRTVVQGPENPLAVGQRVLLIDSKEGRARVVPDSSPQSVQPLAPAPSVLVRKYR